MSGIDEQFKFCFCIEPTQGEEVNPYWELKNKSSEVIGFINHLYFIEKNECSDVLGISIDFNGRPRYILDYIDFIRCWNCGESIVRDDVRFGSVMGEIKRLIDVGKWYVDNDAAEELY